MSETKFKAGDLVKINSTGRVGMIIDLTPPASWGVLQFRYPYCKETQADLKWLKYKSKISIDVLDRKYFLTYLSEDKFTLQKKTENNFPKYDQLFVHHENIKYSIGDLVTIRSSDTMTGDFYYGRSHPLQNCSSELRAIVLMVYDDSLKCLIETPQTYGCGFNLSPYNLPIFARSWVCVYDINYSAIIRKLGHFSLKKKSTCRECFFILRKSF